MRPESISLHALVKPRASDRVMTVQVLTEQTAFCTWFEDERRLDGVFYLSELVPVTNQDRRLVTHPHHQLDGLRSSS